MKRLLAMLIALTLAVFGFGALAEGAADGTYTAAGEGKDGPVVVETTFEGGKIVSVVVTEQNETPEIAGLPLEQIPAAIVEANAYDVDSVTGATVTSDAIKAAVADAIVQAGGALADIAYSKISQGKNPCEIQGEGGSLILDTITRPKVWTLIPRDGNRGDGLKVAAAGGGPRTLNVEPELHPMAYELLDFVRQIENGPEPEWLDASRAVVRTWMSDWGYSPDLILYVAAFAGVAEKKSPLTYLDRMLRSYHEKGLTTGDEVLRVIYEDI